VALSETDGTREIDKIEIYFKKSEGRLFYFGQIRRKYLLFASYGAFPCMLDILQEENCKCLTNSLNSTR
jgi:hypothetical protein